MRALLSSPRLTSTGYPRRVDPRPPSGLISGSALRSARLDAGLGVVELARELGVSVTYVYVLERQDAVTGWIARRHEAGIAALQARKAAR